MLHADRARQIAQIVVFQIVNKGYGIDITLVREIIRVPDITRVPGAPDFVVGLINLRGGVIPVVDMTRRFNLGQASSGDEARIVIVETAGQLVGMWVDRVSEVLQLRSEHIGPPSAYVSGAKSGCVNGIAQVDERLILLLDLQHVLAQEGEAMRVAAAAKGPG